jgi:hypothetical protein
MFEYAREVLERKVKELGNNKMPFKELRKELKYAIEILTERGKELDELKVALGKKK